MKDATRPASDTAPPDHRLAYRFSLLSSRMTRCMTESLRAAGLTVNGWKLLTVVAWHQPMTATDVVLRTSLEADKVSRTVEGLVKLGLLARRHDPADRRRLILTLSPKGERMHAALNQLRQKIEARFMQDSTAAALRALARALDQADAHSAALLAERDTWLPALREAAGIPAARGRARVHPAQTEAPDLP